MHDRQVAEAAEASEELASTYADFLNPGGSSYD